MSAFAAATWIASTAVKGTAPASFSAAATRGSSASRHSATLTVPSYSYGKTTWRRGRGFTPGHEVCAHFKELGDYDYRPAREVADAAETTAVRSVIDVDILGHIFEQSITDLERLRESRGGRRPT